MLPVVREYKALPKAIFSCRSKQPIYFPPAMYNIFEARVSPQKINNKVTGKNKNNKLKGVSLMYFKSNQIGSMPNINKAER